MAPALEDREGAETALFYLGMASNISNSDLLIGLAIGFGGLAVLGFLMVGVGVRICRTAYAWRMTPGPR